MPSDGNITTNGSESNERDGNQMDPNTKPPSRGESHKYYCLPKVPFYLQKMIVYETKSRFYIVASNKKRTRFRMLKLDRTSLGLNIMDDPITYSGKHMQEILRMVDEGNKPFGGLKRTCVAYGILGFVRFLLGYYMLLITKRRKVGQICGHFIYGIEDTAFIYLPHSSVSKAQGDSGDESKYKSLFFGLDLTKDFYFSYTYDLTHSLQHNMTNHDASFDSTISIIKNINKDRLFNEEKEEDIEDIVPEPENKEVKEEKKEEAPQVSEVKNVDNNDSQTSINEAEKVAEQEEKKKEMQEEVKVKNRDKDSDSEEEERDPVYTVVPEEEILKYLDTEETKELNYDRGRYNSMFVWNHFLLSEFMKQACKNSVWILPIIHGYVCQSTFSNYGKPITITLIARRSRYYAGTRFLKRGMNEQGRVANHAETEQIVMYDTPFMHKAQESCPSQYTSFVQIRGSIPLYWGQANSMISPKPDIILQRMDPFYNATILHFAQLFRTYGHPIILLNLVKCEEKKPRETMIGGEFKNAINYLNSMLPEDYKIIYVPFDIKRAHKNKKEGMMINLESISNESIKRVGMFYSGKKLYRNITREERGEFCIESLQRGVIRTNCVDSLDRTNAAQFVIGKTVLGHQLYALGMVDTPSVDLDSDIVELLIDMYEAIGNQLALQYAGSELVNTIKTYRAGNLVTQSRDLFTTVKRYYSNSFTDAEKQHSINLFLGHYVPWKESTPLWDLASDLHLHNYTPKPPHYLFCNTKWWEIPLHDFDHNLQKKLVSPEFNSPGVQGQIFSEYYKPEKLTFFDAYFKYQFAFPHWSPKKIAGEPNPTKEKDGKDKSTPTTFLAGIRNLKGVTQATKEEQNAARRRRRDGTGRQSEIRWSIAQQQGFDLVKPDFRSCHRNIKFYRKSLDHKELSKLPYLSWDKKEYASYFNPEAKDDNTAAYTTYLGQNFALHSVSKNDMAIYSNLHPSVFLVQS